MERDRNVSGRGWVVDCIQNFLKTTQMNMIQLKGEIFIVVTRISFLKDTMHLELDRIVSGRDLV